MKKKEKEMFLELCRFKEADKTKLAALIALEAATPEVLGHLHYNRMGAIAYGVLRENKLLSKLNREFQTSLRNIYEQNKIKNKSYFLCLKMLNEILRKCRGKYAMLKGAYLCGFYPEGFRTSNDIDILVHKRNVEEIGECLTMAGFHQGYIQNGEFLPASRQDIISSKMLRGETVPYILEVNMPFMRYLEVDLNFSMDHKNNENDNVWEFVSTAGEIQMPGHLQSEDYSIITLEKYNFVLHLCCHLYKEASTYPWILMKRDMTLYKMCDLYLLLREYKDNDFESLIQRAKKFGMSGECYYALYITRELFAMESVITSRVMADLARNIPKEGSFVAYAMTSKGESYQYKMHGILNKVISPANKKTYWYENSNIIERFFSKDRIKLLQEEPNN